MRSRLRRGICLALALPFALSGVAAAAAGAWVENAEARARLIADAAGLGLEFELQPGWHVYWRNAGDAGYAPRIDFSATAAIRDARLLFPAPRRFELEAGLVSFGYAGSVIYPIATEIAPGAQRPLAVHARLDYLVCRDECIPHQADLAMQVPPKETAGDAASARLAAARAALPLPAGAAPEAPRVGLRVAPAAGGAWELELTVAGGAWRAAAPDLFFDNHPLFALGRPQLQASKSGLRFRVPLQRLDLTRSLPTVADFAWTLTGFERSAAGTPAPVALSGTASVALPH